MDMVRRCIGGDDRIGKRLHSDALVMVDLIFLKVCKH